MGRINFARKSILWIVVLSLLVALLLYFAFNWGSREYHLGETRTINASIGRPFEVRVFEVPSSGFRNILSDVGLRHVNLVAESFQTHSIPFYKKIGESGCRKFTFLATGAGTDTIRICTIGRKLDSNNCRPYCRVIVTVQ